MCKFKALVEIWISLIKNAIDIIIDRQHDPKITLAKNKVSKYNANTVSILNKKPKAANIIVHLRIDILLLKLINCFFH